MKYIQTFSTLRTSDVMIAGGKGASLGEMFQAGISVPDGYVILATTFEKFIHDTDIDVEIDTILISVDHREMHTVKFASEKIQGLIQNLEIPHDMQSEIVGAFQNLGAEFVAVRSSATAEDGVEHAWAGQLDSYLNVTAENLLQKIQHCWASLFTPRAIFYRFEKGLHATHISVAIVVQKMVNSEVSGIAFSVHPVTEDRNQLIIEAGFGLGEAIVSGSVTPDAYVVKKEPREIVDIAVSEQSRGLFRSPNGGNEWRELSSQGRSQVLSEAQILELSEMILHIEKHYGFPCDIEWAFEGGAFYITQSRPITTLSKKQTNNNSIFYRDWQPVATRNMSLWNDILQARGGRANLVDYGIKSEGHYLFTVENAIDSTLFLESENKIQLLSAIDERCRNGSQMRNLRKIYEKFAKQSLTSLGETQKLLTSKNLQIFFLDYQRISTGLAITTFFGRTGFEKLMQFLLESGLSEVEIPNIIAQLTYPTEHTPLFSSRLDMIEIGILYQRSMPESELNPLLECWLLRHKYIPVNFCEDPWALEDARSQLHNFLKKDCAKLKQTFQSEHDLRILERDKLRKKYAGSAIYDLSDALAEATSLNEYRKNIICRLSYGVRFIFDPLMKKIGSENWRDAYFFTPEELLSISEGEVIDLSRIKESRKKVAVTTDETGCIHWLQDEESKSFYIKIHSQNEDIVFDTTLKGFSANRGKVVGKVRVISSAKDFHKVARGDILVAAMTSVDFVLIMEKAGAFVTNEGGVTSHASIVAREMNKPCIIGTKNTTKVLKDGDLVEVDADNGVVKILERKQDIQWAFTYDRKMSYQRISLFHEGYCKRLSEYFSVEIDNELYRIKDGLVSVFYDEVGHKKAFEKIHSLLSGEKAEKWYKKIHTTIKEDYEKFIQFLDEGENNAQDQNLGTRLRTHMEQNRKISLSTWLLYAYIEDLLSEILQLSLQKKGLKNWKEVCDILAQPDDMLPSDSWEYDTIDVSQGSESERHKKRENIIHKYRSYGMFDVMFSGKDKNAVDEKIAQEKHNASEILKQIQQKYTTQKKALKQIQDMEWSSAEKALIRLYRLYANFKDWKNFHRERSSYQIQCLYVEIAEKYERKIEELWYMTEEEIIHGITQNTWLGKEEIKKRKTNSALAYIGTSGRNITNEKELEVLDGNLTLQKDTLHGTVAYPGKVKGRARIINSHNDLNQLQKGEIIVSSTTRPDYLPFIGDIAGFITNEGGALSHAAILARELKKPCIIGTKVATRVIKTGDMLDMDADNGIVKILERKQDIQWAFTYDRKMSYQRISLFQGDIY